MQQFFRITTWARVRVCVRVFVIRCDFHFSIQNRERAAADDDNKNTQREKNEKNEPFALWYCFKYWTIDYRIYCYRILQLVGVNNNWMAKTRLLSKNEWFDGWLVWLNEYAIVNKWIFGTKCLNANEWKMVL